jgi:hypothetical protein
MATAGTFPSARVAWGAILGACACVLATALGAMAQSPDVVLDIVSSPDHYWNRSVTVRGHVRSVTPDPPGTSRGTYVLRDSSGADIAIETRELPAPGKEFSVSGNVVPTTPTSMAPLIKEARRRAVGELPVAPRVVQPPVPLFPATPAATEAQAPVAESPAPASPQVPAAPIAVQEPASQPASGGLSMNGLVFALIGVVALFSVVMIVAFWPRPQARPAPSPRWEPEGPSMIVLPQRGPKKQERFADAEIVIDHDAVDRATKIVPVTGPRALAQATEVFLDLGASLEVTEGPDKGKSFDLFKPRIGIGRPGSRANEVMLSDLTVSREHASIVYSTADKTFRVVNESGTNPARVNGTPVDEAVLSPDDVIQLGASALAFRRHA